MQKNDFLLLKKLKNTESAQLCLNLDSEGTSGGPPPLAMPLPTTASCGGPCFSMERPSSRSTAQPWSSIWKAESDGGSYLYIFWGGLGRPLYGWNVQMLRM